MSLGLVQNVELGDDVLFLRGQAAHQIRQPEGGYGFFLRRWTGRSKLVVCRQQALIGILPTGSERGCLCFLVIGKPLGFQIVGEVFLFPGIVVGPVNLFADRHSLSIYVESLFFLSFVHGVTSESLKYQVPELSKGGPRQRGHFPANCDPLISESWKSSIFSVFPNGVQEISTAYPNIPAKLIGDTGVRCRKEKAARTAD